MINGNSIASNIRAERGRCGLTAEEVSKELGISRQTYSKYEKDANLINARTLVQLAKIFKCNVSDFFVQR